MSENFIGSKLYPYDDEFEYSTKLERINLDEECEKDLSTNNGFIVSAPRGIKKSLKDIDGIFSTRYGQTIQDMNPFADRYKCECGEVMGRIYRGIVCKNCNTKVKFIDDNFNYFGWIKLNPEYFIIHPNLYKAMSFFIGSTRLDNIVNPLDEKDQDGHSIETDKNPKDEPYFGIGILDFKENFQEIMDYYLTKSPNKIDYYNDILSNYEKIFIHSIPVFTTHLRPFRLDGDTLYYGDTNNMYNMLSRLAHVINNDNLKIFRKSKPKKRLLYDMQCQYNKLYDEIEEILSGKKGRVRTLFGGNCNFSARNVIIPNPRLRMDQVTMSYFTLVELLQQSIINILCKSYNMSFNDAYEIWYKSSITKNDTVYNIIKGIINNTPNGIPILINRNPSISYGSLLQMYVVDINDTHTMSIPLQILKLNGGDFDGDVLNIRYIINKEFYHYANNVFNPRNAMCISRNDGLFNNDVNHRRDTIVNLNTLLNLSRKKYSEECIQKIMSYKNI